MTTSTPIEMRADAAKLIAKAELAELKMHSAALEAMAAADPRSEDEQAAAAARGEISGARLRHDWLMVNRNIDMLEVAANG